MKMNTKTSQCISNKIDTVKTKLSPIIIQAILNLYNSGKLKISSEMTRDECKIINSSHPWDGRLPAICNSMRNMVDCGAKIISDDRDHLQFTIQFFE